MVHIDTNKIRITQSAINQSSEYLGDVKGLAVGASGTALVLGGLCCHRMPQRPRRLRLLVVMLTLFPICDRLAAICSFSSSFPAKPLPSCAPSSSFVKVSEEDSRFLIADPISGELVDRK